MKKCFVLLKLALVFHYFQNGLCDDDEDLIKRTLYKQVPQEPVPSYLSERALPRKIQNSEDWLHHYKSLLSQWNSQRQASEDGDGGQSENESQIQQPLPTTVTKYVSPDTKNVFYLIGKGPKPTEAPSYSRPPPSSSTWQPIKSTTNPPKTTSATEIFSTIKEALSSTTTATTPSSPSSEASKAPRRTQVIDGSLITPEMAGGAALFLTSLLGTFLPVFDSDKVDPSESRESNTNMVMASLRPPPNVRTGYAQVARYQGPRQRRREPNRVDHMDSKSSDHTEERENYLRETQNPVHSVRQFCEQAIDTMEEGLRFENSLSDEALHALFWDLVRRHGIPLSDELRESVAENGGHAQQIAVILDALCRNYQDEMTTTEDAIEIITAGPPVIGGSGGQSNLQQVTEGGGNFVVGQSFSFGDKNFGDDYDQDDRADLACGLC